MAILTPTELDKLRNKAERLANAKGLPIAYVKAEINAALQAIEDKWESNSIKQQFSSAIDAATIFAFTNRQKKVLGAFWLEQKAGREEISI